MPIFSLAVRALTVISTLCGAAIGAARQQRNIHTQLAASQSGKFHFSLENCRTVRFVVLTE